MSYLHPETWRMFSDEERLAFIEDRSVRGKKKSRGKLKSLVLQETISPFDAYTYLHARFGEPNGLQTILVEADSANLFHWDYFLKAGEKDLMFVGASEEVHVWFDGKLSDAKCLAFIAKLKHDFARVAREKGRFASSLEKWSIFPNQFQAIASRCADLYDEIDTALPKIERKILSDKLTTQSLVGNSNTKAHSKLMGAITTAPTELSVLMPVLFESFIGLIVAVLIKQEVRRDAAAFDAFVRGPLNQKLVAMADMCVGFARPLQQNNPSFGRYWHVVNKRNDVIHGNVDPVRDALETVYFHGKRPLFRTGGDRIRQHWIRLVDRYRPQEILDDYLALHDFIWEIIGHMTPSGRQRIEMVMNDTQPGWDNRRKIAGRLFPNHVATTAFEGLRYDWQLERRQ